MRRTPALLIAALSLTPSLSFAQDTLVTEFEDDLLLERVVAGMNGPTGADFLPDGRILITEQGSGNVYVFDETVGGQPTQVGSVPVQSGGERGLLGMAIDPEFATNSRVYFYRSANNRQEVVWATFDGTTLDTTFTPILTGAAGRANHNGGGLVFGADGLLYIGVGDTGCNCGCRPGTNQSNYFGTCLTNLNGKILRIDRDGNIPATNPLIGETNVANCFSDSCNQSAAPTPTGTPRTEIYNWGFRNPWRFSFDSQTGYMWIGDVGEVTWEEITVSVGPGVHHGWPYREGQEGQAPTQCSAATPQSGPCTDPAFAYPRGGGGSVTGGVFLNHPSWPADWRGRYVYGDYVQNRTWYLQPNGGRDGIVGDRVRVVNHGGGGGPVHYFVSPNGPLYFVTARDGEIWRISPAAPATPDAGVADAGATEPDAGAEADAGVVDDDAGVTPNDDGGVTPPRDAGPRADAGGGVIVDPPEEDEGCGCTTTEGTSAGFTGFLLLGLLLWRRRR